MLIQPLKRQSRVQQTIYMKCQTFSQKKKKKNVVCYKFSLALLRVRFVFLFMCYSCMRRSFHVNKLVDYAASSKICLPGIYICACAQLRSRIAGNENASSNFMRTEKAQMRLRIHCSHMV